jgi:hypothetical protein
MQFACGLTFEVRRGRRQGARPARRMICPTASRAWWLAVGPRLDRRVSRQGERRRKSRHSDRAGQRDRVGDASEPAARGLTCVGHSNCRRAARSTRQTKRAALEGGAHAL